MVMNIKTFISVIITGSLFLNACQKNTDIFVPDPGQINGPDTSWHSVITASAATVLTNLFGENISFHDTTELEYLGLQRSFTSIQQAVEIVETFLTTEFEGGRHQNRVDKISC